MDSLADEVRRFGVADYVVFSLSLAVSAAIGIYFGCTGKKQSTTSEFLLADRSMSVAPVAMSLLASFISAITVLGVPAETYRYGLMYLWIVIAFIPAVTLATVVYLPVFYNLQLTSTFKYLEMRFNRPIGIIAACCYILQTMLYMAVVIYGPSLAISAVTGVNKWLSVLAISIVCTFYTSLGGMKAVLWTDTLQVIIMFMGALAVLIQGFIICGWDQVWKDAADSGRLDVNIDPNPLERNTVWSLVIGGTFYWITVYGTNQTQIQRALTIPTLRKAKTAFFINLPMLIVIITISSISGLILYSYYKLCDPLGSERITAVDQIYPLFVMEALGHLPGLPGLIVAAVASSSLSTVSSGLNSLSAVILMDIITPFRKQPISEKHAAILTRFLAIVLGGACICFTLLVANIATILQAAVSLVSVVSGPSFGLFSLGLLFPCSNFKGAITGFLISFALTGFIGFGAQFNPPYFYKFPTSIEGCSSNQTDLLMVNSTSFNISSTWQPLTSTKSVEELIAESRSGVRALYSISYIYLSMVGTLVCTAVGLIVSLATGGQDRSTLDPRLISPVSDILCCCLPLRARECLQCGVVRSEEDNFKEEADETEQKF